MPERSSTPPHKVDESAARLVDVTTPDGPQADELAPPAKNPHAAALGKLGGQKGGPARAAKLSPEARQAIARKAARARWGRAS